MPRLLFISTACRCVNKYAQSLGLDKVTGIPLMVGECWSFYVFLFNDFTDTLQGIIWNVQRFSISNAARTRGITMTSICYVSEDTTAIGWHIHATRKTYWYRVNLMPKETNLILSFLEHCSNSVLYDHSFDKKASFSLQKDSHSFGFASTLYLSHLVAAHKQ